MLTWREFNSLSPTNQLEYLYKHSRFLCVRKTSSHRVYLHYLPNFFVEIYVHYPGGKFKDIVTFKGTKMLEPYLEQLMVKWE
ncbi:hypothetical protein AHMF7605_22495 [Adhaeribacter arboris]|uniref:Uncharacterized protein n=1 Tax=Adhaeribacter arboris TaxID=2072846 RepID=A0A2T2YKN7_9BACT|nr:hypothetical protein [Adhaeribacter arboris]PSR56071.1 hypothetical protein AHMF7605_22495 [Adhaeribacter arboris]